jgi:hypothetical protein
MSSKARNATKPLIKQVSEWKNIEYLSCRLFVFETLDKE